MTLRPGVPVVDDDDGRHALQFGAEVEAADDPDGFTGARGRVLAVILSAMLSNPSIQVQAKLQVVGIMDTSREG